MVAVLVDKWVEVPQVGGGPPYYYNQASGQSLWELPEGAVVDGGTNCWKHATAAAAAAAATAAAAAVIVAAAVAAAAATANATAMGVAAQQTGYT